MKLRAIADVVRGEGVASALRRAAERIEEAFTGPFDSRFECRAPILNVAMSTGARTGGVAIQLRTRLRAEQALRHVALLDPRRIPSLSDMVAQWGVRAVHLEGTSGGPLEELLRLANEGVKVIVSVHDFSLRESGVAARVLAAASAVIYPSEYLRNEYGGAGEVIEPPVPVRRRGEATAGKRDGIAFAGSVKPHKGGALLPELARRVGGTLHVFGGGDVELLRALRAVPNVVVHGYYRSGALPSLLARHGIGTVVLPSIVPESYSLTLSEAWQAGAFVVAFDHGAIAERIRRDGGGALAPPDSGAEGLAARIEKAEPVAPRTFPAPEVAAQAHVALYRRLGLLS